MMLFISHVPIDVRPDPWVLPVGVGGLHFDGGISDRTTGLDAMNDRLCEWSGILTAASLLRSGALVTASPWIGICHYRRLLWLLRTRHGSVSSKFHRKAVHPMASCRALIDPRFVADVLEDFDCIAPRAIFYDCSLSDQYRGSHRREDWIVFLETVREVLGVDAAPFFDRTHTFTPYNMLVMPTERFLAFCGDAQALIDRLLVRIAPVDDRYQNRAIGFLMERFVTFFFHYRRLRVLETPVVLIDPAAR